MINRDGQYTCRFEDIERLAIPPDTVYIYQCRQEERSRLVDTVSSRFDSNVVYVRLESVGDDDGVARDALTQKIIQLSAADKIRSLIFRSGTKNIVFDASGLEVRILGPLLKVALAFAQESNVRVLVLYAEPLRYKIEKFKEEGEYYDLAEKIKGIYPITGFGQLGSVYERSILVPMLGFQGGRFTHIMSRVDYPNAGIYPIVGVSGYRPEYPFVAYYGNRQPLLDDNAWEHVEYAMAGSIVDAFMVLVRIKDTHAREGVSMKIAPIGTKPHAIAALAFACCYPRITELVYDNPIRKQVRTEGIGSISITCVSDLVKPYYDS